MELRQLGESPLYAAMLKLQKTVCIVGSDKAVKGKSKDGKGTFDKYKYTSLDKILETIRPVMIEQGLTLHQPLEYDGAGGSYVHTVIIHAGTGHAIDSKTIIKSTEVINANSAQQFGAGVSYYRRYALLAILGLAAGEEDTDASIMDPELEQEVAWCKRVWKALKSANKQNIADYGASLPHSKRVAYFKEQLAKAGLDVPEEAPQLTMEDIE